MTDEFTVPARLTRPEPAGQRRTAPIDATGATLLAALGGLAVGFALVWLPLGIIAPSLLLAYLVVRSQPKREA